MSSAFFVDSNIIMYAVGGEHPYRDPCLGILDRIVQESLAVVVSTEIHQEILHRYSSLGLGQMARQVSAHLETIIPTALPVTLADIRRVRQLAERYPAFKARDLVHAAVMLENGLSSIISTDRHFDQMDEIERIDPRDFGNHTTTIHSPRDLGS
jgi:predicted nucleic acid-binding protein